MRSLLCHFKYKPGPIVPRPDLWRLPATVPTVPLLFEGRPDLAGTWSDSVGTLPVVLLVQTIFDSSFCAGTTPRWIFELCQPHQKPYGWERLSIEMLKDVEQNQGIGKQHRVERRGGSLSCFQVGVGFVTASCLVSWHLLWLRWQASMLYEFQTSWAYAISEPLFWRRIEFETEMSQYFCTKVTTESHCQWAFSPDHSTSVCKGTMETGNIE